MTQVIEKTIAVLTSSPFLFVHAELFADSNGTLQPGVTPSELSGVADFANTGLLSVTLPPGFAFQSEAGVIGISQPGVTVAEHSALALLGIGLGGLAVIRRRKTVN